MFEAITLEIDNDAKLLERHVRLAKDYLQLYPADVGSAQTALANKLESIFITAGMHLNALTKAVYVAALNQTDFEDIAHHYIRKAQEAIEYEKAVG